MGEPGTLIHPTVKCQWGDYKIHYQKVGGMWENMLQQMTLTLTTSDAPKLEFKITANPYGFELFRKMVENREAGIRAEYGYRGVDSQKTINGNFTYSGMQLTTGMQPSLTVTAVGKVKVLGSNKVSQTIEAEEGVSGRAFAYNMKDAAGTFAKDIEFDFKPGALEKLERIKVKNNVISQVPYKAIVKQFNPVGVIPNLGSSAMDDGAVIMQEPASAGGLLGDQAIAASTQEDVPPRNRGEYIIGLGLVTNITRKQEFQLGENPTTLAAAQDMPLSQQTNDQIITEQISGSREDDLAKSYNVAGTSGVAEPGNNKFTLENLISSDTDDQSNLVAGKATTVSFQCLMVPYMVGIKPMDMILIASLKGDFAEDYEVQKVVYSQNAQGVVMLSIEAMRDYTGGKPMQFNDIRRQVQWIKALNEGGPEAWTAFYWNQGADILKNIAGGRSIAEAAKDLSDFNTLTEFARTAGGGPAALAPPSRDENNRPVGGGLYPEYMSGVRQNFGGGLNSPNAGWFGRPTKSAQD